MINIILYNYHTKRLNKFRDATEYTDKMGEIRIVHGNAVTLMKSGMYRLVEIEFDND